MILKTGWPFAGKLATITTMKNFANQNLDITIGAAIATLLGQFLRANDMNIPADTEIAIGMLVVAVMARLGFKFAAKPKPEKTDA